MHVCNCSPMTQQMKRTHPCCQQLKLFCYLLQCHMMAASHKNMQPCPNMHLFLPAQYKQAILCMSGVCGVCSVDDMVVAAVISLQDPVGSGPDDICAWIEVRRLAFSPLLLDSCIPCHTACTCVQVLFARVHERHRLHWHPAVLCSSRFCLVCCCV